MSKEHRYVGASPEVRKINKQAAVARLTSRLIGNADVSQKSFTFLKSWARHTHRCSAERRERERTRVRLLVSLEFFDEG